MTPEMTYRFPPQASSPGEARTLACAWAEALGPEELVALELIVSELVTNAVQHGTGEVTMVLAPTENGVRVGVHDHGGGVPAPRVVTARSTGGRGLQLVESLSSDWGVARAGDLGKTVWAQIAGHQSDSSALDADVHGASRETGTAP